MFIVHFLINFTIVALEVTLALALGWLAWRLPIIFAGMSAGLAVGLGLRLELKRLAFEMPFYFERTGRIGRFVRVLMGAGIALLKGAVAGLVALMTFSGTEPDRLWIVAAVFAACVLIGSTLLRRLTISFGARPAQWGFFRMMAPLGLLFSLAMSLLPAPSVLEVVRRVLLELPERPSLSQAGEALFAVRLWIDDLIVRTLAGWVGPEWAQGIGIVIGSNVLAGFVIAVHAVVLSELVRKMEEAHWRLRGYQGIRG